jgi:hypothetical protein
MRARTETIELGERVSRALTMENSGPVRRRIWWIVSSAVLAPFSGPQAGGRTMGPDLTSASIDTATGQVRYVFDEAEDDDRSRWPGPRRSPPRAPPSTPGAPCASLDAADPSAAQPSCPRAGQLLEARATSRRGSAFLGSAGMVAHPAGPGQLADAGRDPLQDPDHAAWSKTIMSKTTHHPPFNSRRRKGPPWPRSAALNPMRSWSACTSARWACTPC